MPKSPTTEIDRKQENSRNEKLTAEVQTEVVGGHKRGGSDSIAEALFDKDLEMQLQRPREMTFATNSSPVAVHAKETSRETTEQIKVTSKIA